MQEQLDQKIAEAKKRMQKAIDHLHTELQQIRTGKANPSMLNNIKVDYYGTQTPLNQTANISASDSKTLVIQPWDKNMIQPIEKAIFEANIGLTPQNDGDLIRISIPNLTEERRKELVKQCRSYAEDAKVSIRRERHHAMDAIKSAVKDGYPEDAAKRMEDKVEKMTHEYTDKVDKVMEAKENDIMTV
jgi:ribosome recycling factor